MNQLMGIQLATNTTVGSIEIPSQGTKGRLLVWGFVIVFCYVCSEMLTPHPAVLKGFISAEWWDLMARKSFELLMLAFLIPVLLKREGLTLADIGFDARVNRQDVYLGIAAGSVIWLIHFFLLNLAAVRTGGAPVNEGMINSINALHLGPAEMVGLFVVIVVQGPFMEEVLYRGCMMASNRSSFGPPPWKTAVIVTLSGVVFALVHSLGHPLYLSVYWLTGVALALLYQKTGLLGVAAIAHATINAWCLSADILKSWLM